MTPSAPGLNNRIRRAAAGIDPALTDSDVDRLVEGVHQRRRRRAVRRVGLAAATAAMAAGALFLAVRRAPPAHVTATAPPEAARQPPSAVPEPAARLRLADGSVVTRLDAGSALSVVEDTHARVLLELRRGRERFEVVPRPAAQRSFRVRAGEVTITVIGTVFTMERVADRIGVAVERGTVRVDWGRGARALHGGDSGWFPPLVVGARAEPLGARSPSAGAARTAARPDPAPAPGTAPRADPTPPAAVRSAESGGESGSKARVESGGESDVELLWAAADAARVAGKPEEGAALLARLLRQHRADPRAPLAAFTLGRLLMIELARPREAAAAFAEVRTLRPDGPFAEDALAREVEALARAGDTVTAQARARDYLRLYPNGRRLAAVKALGGQE